MPLSFLLIGISFDEFPALFPAGHEEMESKIRAGLKLTEDQFKGAGLDYEFLEYSPKEDMSRLEGILKGGKYDGVVIGFGIRGQAPFTPLFERLVNTIHSSEPSAKFIFNTSPEGTLDAAKRQFPEIQ